MTTKGLLEKEGPLHSCKFTIVAGALAASLASCAPTHGGEGAAISQSVIVDDALTGTVSDRFQYSGTWEHVHGRRDGRHGGTSSRSMHIGDSALLTFVGSRIELYGIKGPNGGAAIVALDGYALATCDFYASRKIMAAQIFASPRLATGPHAISLVVTGSKQQHQRAYVNIDYARIVP